MSEFKEVSLYIPYFNSQDTIEECLDAVLKQTYPVKEIIVVDDGSIYPIQEKVCKRAVRLIRHECNLGLSAARNTAIRNIDSEFVAALDSDCVPDMDWLKHLMEGFKSEKVAAIGGRVVERYFFTPADLWRSVHMKQSWGDATAEPPFLFGSNTVFRRKALQEAGCYDESLKTNYEDVDISRRVKGNGHALVYEPEALAYHVRRDNAAIVLDKHWNWHSCYYQECSCYSDLEKLAFKVKEAIWTANRYLDDDVHEGRTRLYYLDFLSALYNSLRDFEFFICSNSPNKTDKLGYSRLSAWLAVVDLTFFYHYNFSQDRLSTLVPDQGIIFQNCLALIMLIYNLVTDMFENKNFRRILFRDLLSFLYRIDDQVLLDRIINLAESHKDWSNFLHKAHPNLNKIFLETVLKNFIDWKESLIQKYPGISCMIEEGSRDLN